MDDGCGQMGDSVIGWALDRTMTTALILTALRQALSERPPLPGLVHHSDRGV